MDLGVAGKVALVLGGGSGIGKGIALALAREGVDVAVVGRTAETLERVVAEIEALGVRGYSAVADLADPAFAENLVADVGTNFGVVDILVNNSGGPPPSSMMDADASVWAAQFQAMFVAITELTRLVVPAMQERGWGRVITVASAGLVQPFLPLGVSNALRAGIAAWSKTLAGEVASSGVTCNLLLPATTKTARLKSFWRAEAERTGIDIADVEARAAEGLPMRRFGTVEEFGDVAAFLASARASYITGSMIRVDGGYISSI